MIETELCMSSALALAFLGAAAQLSTYLDGESSLANTAISKHDQLVQGHFSRHLDWTDGCRLELREE